MTDIPAIDLPKGIGSLLEMAIIKEYGEGVFVPSGSIFIVDEKAFKQEADGLYLKHEDQWIPVEINFHTMDITLRRK